MRALITGATGFIGGQAARRLVRDGHEVVAYVRSEERTADLAAAGVEVRVGSLGDPNAIADAASGCDTIIHCAAATGYRSAKRAYSWVNVAGTDNVVNAARHAEVRRLVYMSCADVTLTNWERLNCNERQVLMEPPLGAHARSKSLAEEGAITASGDELEVVALRPAWVWGPGDTSRLPGLCAEGLSGGMRMVGRGDNLVAITYIDNLIDAVVAATRAKGAVGGAYYIADNEFLSLREFFGPLSETLGLPVPRRGPGLTLAFAMARLRGPTSDGLMCEDVVIRGRGVTFDISRGLNDLEWEPRVGLDDGMQALGVWAREVGGAKAIAELGRPPETAESVDGQVEAAGGD